MTVLTEVAWLSSVSLDEILFIKSFLTYSSLYLVSDIICQNQFPYNLPVVVITIQKL
jgi:hypothetical protein